MGASGEDPGLEEKPTFLNDGDIFLTKTRVGKVRLKVVPYPSSREKMVPATSPQKNSCSELPDRKNDSVTYPGRSVLYSRQFRPLNRIQHTEDKNPPVV